MTSRLALVGLVGILLVGGLTGGELYRNEGLRARLAWEAFHSGEWLVPSLYGEPHLTKPPGMSALIGLCSLPWGEVTPLTARFPSILAGLLAISLVGWSVARAAGPRAGWLAAVMLPCCPLWLDRVPSAEIDLVQLAWVTAALLLLNEALQTDRWSAWLGAFLCVTGGFFTKWTAPGFFYLTLLPLLYWRGELRRLCSLRHLTGLTLLVCLAGLWLALVARSTGLAPLGETLSREAFLRLSPGHHPRPYPWDELATFPLGFLAGCLPWAILVPVALRPSFASQLTPRGYALWQLALVWAISSLVFWTLAPGHRPRHILPAQPAIVLLAALVAEAWLAGQVSLRLPARPVLVGCCLFWLGIKLAWVMVVVPARNADRMLAETAARLRQLVPEAESLHLLRLKDDGLLFYYGRTARRRTTMEATSAGWWLVTGAERATLAAPVIATLRDGQGDQLYLVHRTPQTSHLAGDPCRTDLPLSKE
ncbi:MAG: glycosyltransferase family 39 protein [Gemmataceae bacterium]